MLANFVNCQSCRRKDTARNTGSRVGDFWVYYCPVCGHRFYVAVYEKVINRTIRNSIYRVV